LLTHGNTDHDLTSIYGRTASGLNWEEEELELEEDLELELEENLELELEENLEEEGDLEEEPQEEPEKTLQARERGLKYRGVDPLTMKTFEEAELAMHTTERIGQLGPKEMTQTSQSKECFDFIARGSRNECMVVLNNNTQFSMKEWTSDNNGSTAVPILSNIPPKFINGAYFDFDGNITCVDQDISQKFHLSKEGFEKGPHASADDFHAYHPFDFRYPLSKGTRHLFEIGQDETGEVATFHIQFLFGSVTRLRNLVFLFASLQSMKCEVVVVTMGMQDLAVRIWETAMKRLYFITNYIHYEEKNYNNLPIPLFINKFAFPAGTNVTQINQTSLTRENLQTTYDSGKGTFIFGDVSAKGYRFALFSDDSDSHIKDVEQKLGTIENKVYKTDQANGLTTEIMTDMMRLIRDKWINDIIEYMSLRQLSIKDITAYMEPIKDITAYMEPTDDDL
jgi:hypothetical protein